MILVFTCFSKFLKKTSPLACAVPGNFDLIVHVAIQFLNHLETNLINCPLVARVMTIHPFMDNSLPRFATFSYDSGLAVNFMSDQLTQKMYDICVFRQCSSMYSIRWLSSALMFLYIYGMTGGFIISILYN